MTFRTTMNPHAASPVLPLCQLPAGTVGRVLELTGPAEFCQRVREMGLGESSFVTKVGGSGPFICQINGNRVALSHDAARAILVEPLSRR